MKTLSKTDVGHISDFPLNLGTCVLVNDRQIAVFRLETEQTWYAVQNLNPQNQRTVLSRGITGDIEGTPFVACPLHKYRYALDSGKCLTDDSYSLETYTVEVKDDRVYIES